MFGFFSDFFYQTQMFLVGKVGKQQTSEQTSNRMNPHLGAMKFSACVDQLVCGSAIMCVCVCVCL